MNIKLEKYYDQKTEESLNTLAALSEEKWSKYERKESLLSLVNNETYAKIICAYYPDNCEKWVKEKAPALDNLSIYECMTQDLGKRVGVMLTRLP